LRKKGGEVIAFAAFFIAYTALLKLRTGIHLKMNDIFCKDFEKACMGSVTLTLSGLLWARLVIFLCCD